MQGPLLENILLKLQCVHAAGEFFLLRALYHNQCENLHEGNRALVQLPETDVAVRLVQISAPQLFADGCQRLVMHCRERVFGRLQVVDVLHKSLQHFGHIIRRKTVILLQLKNEIPPDLKAFLLVSCCAIHELQHGGPRDAPSIHYANAAFARFWRWVVNFDEFCFTPVFVLYFEFF